MKAFRHKLTGRLGETQFGNDTEVLIHNAKSAGFQDAEIEIIDMTLQDYREAIKTQNENDMSKEQKDEIKIKKEMDRILREQAIANLRAKGEI
jgi:exopolyphosphatase/pppGpp-phosphohydrolase